MVVVSGKEGRKVVGREGGKEGGKGLVVVVVVVVVVGRKDVG